MKILSPAARDRITPNFTGLLKPISPILYFKQQSNFMRKLDSNRPEGCDLLPDRRHVNYEII